MKSDPRPPGVTFSVTCPCGFGADSEKVTAEDAIAEMQARHHCTEPLFTAVAYGP